MYFANLSFINYCSAVSQKTWNLAFGPRIEMNNAHLATAGDKPTPWSWPGSFSVKFNKQCGLKFRISRNKEVREKRRNIIIGRSHITILQNQHIWHCTPLQPGSNFSPSLPLSLWMTITFQPMLWIKWNFLYFSKSIRTIGSQKIEMIKQKIMQ